MTDPNVNGRLHLTGVHQRPPASLKIRYITLIESLYFKNWKFPVFDVIIIVLT